MSKKQVGIGLKLNSKLSVIEVVAGGPAAAAGVIHEGDTILAIGGREVTGWTAHQCIPLIAGDEGTYCELLIRKAEGGPNVQMRICRGAKPQAGVGCLLQVCPLATAAALAQHSLCITSRGSQPAGPVLRESADLAPPSRSATTRASS
jgi:hypothetical protein